MARRTSANLGLTLEDNNEFCGIETTAENFGKIDDFAGETDARLDAIEEPTFSAASSLTEPNSGEDHATVFGKLKKAIRSLISHMNASGSHDAATQNAAGFLSAADKAKLDGCAQNANNYTYTHPSYTQRAKGFSKISVTSNGHVSSAAAVQKSDITALGISSYTHPAVEAKELGFYMFQTDNKGHITSARPVTKSDITSFVDLTPGKTYPASKGKKVNLTFSQGTREVSQDVSMGLTGTWFAMAGVGSLPTGVKIQYITAKSVNSDARVKVRLQEAAPRAFTVVLHVIGIKAT